MQPDDPGSGPGTGTASIERCPLCGQREDPYAPDCCECLDCERCDRRAPLHVHNAKVLTPPGWRLRDDGIHLCWHCAEHTDIAAWLEQR